MRNGPSWRARRHDKPRTGSGGSNTILASPFRFAAPGGRPRPSGESGMRRVARRFCCAARRPTGSRWRRPRRCARAVPSRSWSNSPEWATHRCCSRRSRSLPLRHFWRAAEKREAPRSKGGASNPGSIVYNRGAKPDAANVMALALSLPPLEARPANPPETRPARVQPWLEETRKRDPVEAAGVIGDALAATNRVALSESRRLELAERYYSTALTLWPNLERHFARAQHPLTGNALAAAKAALTLSTELATAYKHLLAHEAAKRSILSSNRVLVALMHRCLQCTNRILINSYQSYAPVPARTWHDAHAIYVFALERNLQMTPVASDSVEATPERYYVQALLLALANPYGFMPGQLLQVLQYLQEHAHWARITDVTP